MSIQFRLVHRSVGAILRAEMLNRKQQNKQLQQELEDLRLKLSQASAHSFRKPDHLASDNTELVTLVDHQHSSPRNPDGQQVFHRSRILQKSEELARKSRSDNALEKQYEILRAREREKQNKKRAIVLERKRRLLEHDPNVLQVADDDDEFTLEDQAATQIQRIARGVDGRSRVKKLRPVLNSAATLVQGIIRGHLGRSYACLKETDRRSAMNIQRVWRGHLGRCVLQSTRRQLEHNTAARNIQRVIRGLKGRRRVQHKRGLQKSARRGAEVVGIKQLFHQDIVELADAVDPASPPKPPGIVLGLLKAVALMLEEVDQESGAVTRYSALGVHSLQRVNPALNFSWDDAHSLLRRSCKLLRRLRQVAEGPASRRPRMVYFSQASVQTYHALRCDRGWNTATIARVGGGAKASTQLMMWVDALQEVFAYQREFAGDLGSNRMPWVARSQQSIRCMRHLELSRMVWDHASTCLQKILRDCAPITTHSNIEYSTRRRGDLRLRVAESALDAIREREICVRDALNMMKQEEQNAQQNDEAQELLRAGILAEDLEKAEASLIEKTIALKSARIAVQDGIQPDQTHLQQCLDEVTTCEVVRRERWTCLQLFLAQQGRNSNRRGVHVEVWGDLRHQLQLVGESEAASILAAQDLEYFREERESSGGHELEALRSRENDARLVASAARMQLDLMEESKETTFSAANEAEVSDGLVHARQ